MSREIEFDVDARCDICAAKGAFDFYGDYVCPKCLNKCKNVETLADLGIHPVE